MSRKAVVAGLGLAVVLVLAGCSNDSATQSGSSPMPPGDMGPMTPASPATGGPASGGATIATSRVALGEILVDSAGRTLYLFTSDQGSTSTCTGGCAQNWPPVTVTGGAPMAGAGVDASKLGTTTRSDGTTQVTYNGHPLYTYAADRAPGDTNGQGVGGNWFVISPAGERIGA